MSTKKKTTDKDILKKLDEALKNLKQVNKKSEGILENAQNKFTADQGNNKKAKQSANENIISTVQNMDAKTLNFIKDTE